MSLTAVVFGSTGSVGKELVSALVSSPKWKEVVVVTRSPPSTPDTGKIKTVVQVMPPPGCDSSELASLTSILEPKLPSSPSAVFCALGVGAPSKGPAINLTHVDVDLTNALLASCKGSHLSLLTAIGANRTAPQPKPSAFFPLPFARAGGPLYNFCKGKVESLCLYLPYSTRSFFQPATLIGTPNTPPAFAAVAPKLDWMLPADYKSSSIKDLARAMVYDAERALEEPVGKEDVVWKGGELHGLYEEVRVKGIA